MIVLEDILSQEIIQKLGWTLLHFIWQAAVAALLLAILLRVLRKSTANLRYIIACLALGLIVLLPVITIQLVSVSAPQSPAHIEPAPAPAVLLTEEMPAAETIVLEEPVQPESVTLVSADSWKQRTVELLEPALPYIVSGWLVGVFGLSIWHLGGWAQLQRLRRRMVKQVDDTLHSKLSRLAQRLRVKQTVQLMESALVQIPTVVGWLRPVILLPASALTGLSSEQLEAILAHELAHIRRHDYLVNILQTVVDILGFYHPAVWWVSHKIRAERENCCDDLAVSISGDRVCYARALTSMEEIRADRGELAVAATGGNLLGRIRRLVGKDAAEKSNFSWVPAATVILLIIALAIPATITLTARAQEKPEGLAGAVIKGIRANRDKFECGYLAWSSKHINNRFADSNRPATELAGQYELWWDGKKIATKYVRDQVYKDPEGNFRVEKGQGGTSYDGGVLSWKPDFHSDNWLGPEVTRWRGLGSQDWLIQQGSKQEGIRRDWSVVDNNGVKLIRVMARNMNEKSIDYGAYSIRDYDPLKGYGLVNEEWYNPNGSPRLKHTVKMLEVIPGGWFPVEVDFKSFTITDGRVYTHQHYALDIERCSFNDKSALPDRVFKGAVDKQLKYQQKLQKYLAMELRGISDVKEAAKADKVKRGAREAIEKFVAAAMAGDLEKARQFAHPDKLPANQIADITEIAKGQNLWIMAVVADDFDAIAVSSVILGDHDRIGPLVFFLDRELQDGRDNWWVHDIDMETPDGAEGELKQFLEKHPEAEKIPSEKKPDVQVEAKTNVPIEDRKAESAVKLKQLGLAVAMYADEHDDNLPDSLRELKPYIRDEQDFNWLLDNIKYLGSGKSTQRNAALIPIAYDRELLEEADGTNVLSLDFSVRFLDTKEFEKLDIKRAEFLIETWFLAVNKDFIENINHNADSPDEAKELFKLKSELLAASDGSNKLSFIPPERNVNLLLKAVRAHKDSKVLAAPKVLCRDNKTAKIKVMSNETYYIVGYTEPNNPSEKPEPKLEKVEEGFSLSLKPNLTPNKNIVMQFEFKISKFLDSEERKFQGKAPYKPPKIQRNVQSFYYRVQNGQTLLFGGHKIADQQDGRTEQKDLLVLIKAQTIGSSEQDKSTKTENLIVTEPPRTTTNVITQPAIAKGRTERRKDNEQEKTKPATEQKPQMVQKFFKLKNYSSSQMGQILMPLLTKTGYISADESTGNLLVIDTVENLMRIEKIIAAFDVSVKQTVTEIFEIRYGDPTEIVELLKKLINGRPGFGAIIEPGKQTIVLIPEPRRKWIIAKASAENIKQIGQWIEKLDTRKTIGMDPIDVVVYEQLETIVDLSDLTPDMSFGEVIERLKISVEPPVQIQPIWKDLLENAEVERATQAGMDPLTRVKLRKALEILLAGVSSTELAKLNYIVDGGVILIGTVDMLHPKMVHRVYDISDLVGTAADADALIHRITETIEPDGWYGLSDTGYGTITAYPLRQPKKFAVMQTYEIHQQIEHFLDDMRSSRDERKTQEHEPQPSQVQAKEDLELVEIEKRVESGKKLSNLGKALLIYANDHEDKYPDSLHTFTEYLKLEDFNWAMTNVEYLARGKTIAVRPDIVIAYDKKLLAERKGTNVLFNDSHVEFVKPERLKELGIGANAILIDIRLLSVSEDFLKDIGLDANSISSSDAWSEHLVADSAAEPNSETYSLILDDLNVRLLLKAVQAHQGSKMLAAPQVLCQEGKTASIAVLTEEYYVLGYTEPNRPSDEPVPKLDKVEIGTRIWLKPEITPDNKNINLDFKLEIRQLLGFEKRKYKGKYPYGTPQTEVVSIKTHPLVPDGKTLLIGGLKITEQAEIQSSVPILSKLPLIGKTFRSRSTIKDHKILLILVKPTINPQQKASKILPGEADDEEHIKSLGRLLEKKLNPPAEQK